MRFLVILFLSNTGIVCLFPQKKCVENMSARSIVDGVAT